MCLLIVTFLTIFGILHEPYTCNALAEVLIRGDLIGGFKFNFTIYLRKFEANIFHCVDHNLNLLDLQVRRQERVFLSYNKKTRRTTLKELCGCHDCSRILVNLVIVSSRKSVTLSCNKRSSVSLVKIYTRNKVNSDVSNSIQPLVNRSNSLYISLPIYQPGCIHSFYFNDQPLYFKQVKSSSIMLKCPRTCKYGICNKGQCRALDKDGPTCDCATTALNGDHCNRKLRTYDPKTKHSYQMQDKDKFMFLKFTWRIFENNRYCMLEFVDRKRHVTFSLDSAHFLKGSASLTEINKDDINFVTVSKAQNILNIKVNSKSVQRMQLAAGDTTINVGFTEKNENCLQFDGEYDVFIQRPGIRMTKKDRNFPTNNTSTKQFNQIEISQFIRIYLTLLVSFILVSVVLVIVRSCGKVTGNRKTNEKFYLHSDQFHWRNKCLDIDSIKSKNSGHYSKFNI